MVRELDRLSRNLAKQLVVEEELKRAGVRIEYVLGEYPDNPEGRLQKHIKATIAEYERKKIVERTLRGRRRAVEAGSVLQNGHRTFGYRRVQRLLNPTKPNGAHLWALKIDEEEAHWVRQIFQWYIYGDKAGRRIGVGTIALMLTDAHVLTVEDRDHARAPKRHAVGVWHKATVQGMIGNETYAGVWRWGKSGKPGEQISVEVPAIVSRETWQAAQERLAENGPSLRRQPKNNYLMGNGRLTCLTCQSRLGTCPGYTRRKDGTKRPNNYYRCPANTQRYAGHCDVAPYIRCEWADAAVWQWVRGFLLNPALLDEGLRQYQERCERENVPMQERLKVVKGRIEWR